MISLKGNQHIVEVNRRGACEYRRLQWKWPSCLFRREYRGNRWSVPELAARTDVADERDDLSVWSKQGTDTLLALELERTKGTSNIVSDGEHC
ncbi:hypothetical protein U1Q18_052171 [Sarracenia purpurea var. burkii]